MRLRSALAAPFRLAPIDLLAALAIVVIAFSLAVGPVVSQDASTAAEPTASADSLPPTASPQPVRRGRCLASGARADAGTRCLHDRRPLRA